MKATNTPFRSVNQASPARTSDTATASAGGVFHWYRVSWSALKHCKFAALLLCGGGVLCTSFSALALPSNDPGNPDAMEQHCLPEIKVSGEPRLVGFALVGQTVTIDAAHVKLVNVGDFCGDFGHALGTGDFQWQFFLPPGSSGLVTDTDTLRPRVTLDVPGQYTAMLTPCPGGCEVESGDPGLLFTVEIEPQPQRAVSFATEAMLRPETLPVLPASARQTSSKTLATRAQRDERCLFGGGIVDPQWVTIEPFNGPPDYAGGLSATGSIRSVEGVVFKSKVSRKDSPLNHSGHGNGQDHNFDLKPDPAHESALLAFGEGNGTQSGLDIEWETGDFDARYRPGNGDRVSALGYWIHDCGHEPFAAEIHPPIAVAVHRPRAIHIPNDAEPNIDDWPGGPVGTNIFVPGVLTEVFLNRRAGKMMHCGLTGLHQPGKLVPNPSPSGPPFLPTTGDCIEDPSPISGYQYSFNIYLPLNAKAALERAGVTGLPAIPLYYEVIDDGLNTLPITLVPVTEGDVTYLNATVDFRNINPDADANYTAQIVAAWVYPASDNWGLQRWRVQVDELAVRDDSDGSFRGEGEWNLFFHVNNAMLQSSKHEWTKIVDERVSDHRYELGPGGVLVKVGPPLAFDFHQRPWSTGPDVDADRSLGPDLTLFPGQMIQVHTSGFESDSVSSDSLALVEDLRPQQIASYASNNTCKQSDDIDSLIYSGCADYDLTYQVINRGYVPGASLSEGAKALMANYDFGDGGGCPPGGDDVCPPVVVIGDLPEPVQDEPWHPDNVVLAPDDPPQSIHDSGLFRPQGIEEFAITEASIARFNAVIVDRLATDPEAVEEMLIDLRASIDELLVRVGPEVLLDVRVICAALPSELCQRHFGDLPQPAPPSDATLRRFTGAGHMNDPERTKFTLGLHCNPLVGHNRFKVAWGNKPTHHFETDLLTSAACETAPEPLRTHRGWGLGKLDGSPGAKAHWSLTDAGEPGRDDTVVIEIYDPENNLLRRVEGRISGGNLQAHER